jgi:hypothetical protein
MNTITVTQQQLPSNVRLALRALISARALPNGEKLEAMPWLISGFIFDQQQLQCYRECFQFSKGSVPLTYLFVATQQAQLSFLSQSAVKVKLLGLVHVSIEFDQQAPIEVGRTYQVKIALGEQLWTDKGLQFDVVVDFWADEERQFGFVSRYIQLNRTNSSTSRQSKPTDSPQPAWSKVKDVDFSKTIGREYAAISNDYNPIHLTPLLSKMFGFRRPIVHGMYSAALLLSAQTLGNPRRVSVTFKKPIMMPNQAQLVCSGASWALLLEKERVAVQVDFEV